MSESIPANSKLSHYRIISKLGAGGMGEVYLAHDTLLDRQVAIKLLPTGSTQDEASKKRLVVEARAAAKLDHPNICSVYEVGDENGRQFIVMQYVEGERLDVRASRKPLDLPELLSIASQVADALADAHNHSIIHRDIKPANIILTSRGQAKVMDFGLAKSIRSKVDTEANTELVLTSPGAILGTLPYMSPEQVKGEQLDARSDIFSFGVMIYELVTGRQPFACDSAAGTASAILTQEPPALARFTPEIPDELQRIVRKCLAKSRERRYQSASDLAIDLENIRRDSESSSQVGRLSDGAGFENNRESRTRSAKERALFPGGEATADLPLGTTRKRTLSTPVLSIAIALIGLVGAWVVYQKFIRHPIAQPLPQQIKSLAVLPLENLSGDPAQEYFADGMTEALTTELAKISALRVISRTSAMQYKGVHKALPEIARELNVDGILQGSVLRSSGRVKISAQLIQGGTDQQLWAGEQVRELTDILSLQSEVAKSIAKQVRIQLTPQETVRLSRPLKVNPEAHDAYLQGRFYFAKDAREDLEKAREYFEEALKKDPQYAPAYAGLADYYSVLPFYTNARPDDVFPKAKEAIARALQLDNSLPEAHGTQAYILTYYDWNWAAAEQEFQQALALNPNDATLRHRYSRYLSSLGRTEEALNEIERARLLDPSDLVIQANVGVIYYFARQYDRAIDALKKVLQEHPDFRTAIWGLGLAYEQKGINEQALTELEKAAERKRPNALASLGHFYGSIGRKQEAKKILSELDKQAGQESVSKYYFALVHVGLGDNESALATLEKAYQEHATLLSYLKMDPRFDPLRGDARFQDLMRRMNFPT